MKLKKDEVVVSPSPLKSPPPQPWDIDFSNDPGLTRQEFKDDCDVNVIIARCVKQGLPLPTADIQVAFADVSEIGDFGDCVRRIQAAEEAFMALPAQIRSEFNNDPAQLVSFISDEANRDKAVALGLVPAKPALPAADSPPPAASPEPPAPSSPPK